MGSSLKRMVDFLALPGSGVCAWIGRDPDDPTADGFGNVSTFLLKVSEAAKSKSLAPLYYHLRDGRSGELYCPMPGGRFCRCSSELASQLGVSRSGLNGSLDLATVLKSLAEYADKGQPEQHPLLILRWDEVVASGYGVDQVASQLLNLNRRITFRKARLSILIYFRSEEDIPERLKERVPIFHIPPPDGEEIELLLKAGLSQYPEARLDGQLALDKMAHLCQGLCGSTIYRIIKESAAYKEPVKAEEIRAERQREVRRRSGGLLIPMEGKNIRLVGRAIQPVLLYGEAILRNLERGDPATPLFILLAGPPGVGKTASVYHMAHRYPQIHFYRAGPIKHSLVGQSERNMETILTMTYESRPSVLFIDEFTGMVPTRRLDSNTDSGVSNAMLAMLLESLGNQERAGRTLLIGTTNDPSLIDAALLDRAQIVPVFNPLPEDYPEILVANIALLNGKIHDPKEEWIQEAAQEFYRKRASPRAILDALRLIYNEQGKLGPEEVLMAAEGALDKSNSPEWLAARLAELRAIQMAVHKHLFPWHTDPSLIPDYLRRIFNLEGEIDQMALADEIRDLERYLAQRQA